MDRRKFLVGSGAAVTTVLAGCTDGTEEVEGGTREENGNNSTDTTEEETNASDEPDDSEESNATEESDADDESTGSASVEIVDHELVVEEGEFSTDVFVEATVENTGDVPSGEIQLQADWYDGDGNYLDNDTGWLTTLDAGETWSARVYYLGTNPETVDDYELEGEFAEDVYEEPEGMSLVDSNMEVAENDFGEMELRVEGEVENESGDDQSYVEVVATIYDDDGVVLGDELDNVTDLRAGDTWAFSIDYFTQDVQSRADRAADHDILIKTSAW